MAIPILLVTVAITAAAAAYAVYAGSKAQKNSMSPQGLDSFGITQVAEGTCVPLIYGIARVPGNMIWFGNLITEEIKEKAGGGKGGGGGGGAMTGYRYYLDVWQTIGYGKLNLVETYINDKIESVDASSTTWNDGVNGLYSANPPDESALNGIAHVFYNKWKIGDNTTTVPTIHFVVSRELATPVSYQNMTYGNNPAAIIYDLLTLAGVPSASINLTAFNAAATYWNSVGYALNFVFAEQKSLYELINTVFSQVDGVLYVDHDGKYALAAFDPARAAVATIADTDIYEFSMQLPTYGQLPNDFKATFKDREQAYSVRSVQFQNQGVVKQVGREIAEPMNLEGFIDATVASARIIEIAKDHSYPAKTVEFSTNYKYASVVPGDIVILSYAPLGIMTLYVRIDTVDVPSQDTLELKFRGRQVAERLFDAYYSKVGGSDYAGEDYTPSTEAAYRAELSLPYNPLTLTVPNRLFLTERASGSDIGYYVQSRAGVAPTAPYVAGSDAAGGYASVARLTSFARFAEIYWPTAYALHTDYPRYPEYFDHTYDLDDQAEGITIYTVDALDLTLFPPLLRNELFTTPRFLWLGTYTHTDATTKRAAGEAHELIAFQTITAITAPVGRTEYFYRITNFLRAALYTTKQTHQYHSASKYPVGFLFTLGTNYLEESLCLSYRQLIFESFQGAGDGADTHPYFPLSKSYSLVAGGGWNSRNVWGNCRVVATRSGSNISVQVYPAQYDRVGAGLGNPGSVTDTAVFTYSGTLVFEHGVTVEEKTSPTCTYSFTDAAEVTLKVYSLLAHDPSKIGTYGELVVAVADGEYVGYTTRLEAF